MIRPTAIATLAILTMAGGSPAAAQEAEAPAAGPMWLISCSNQMSVDELLCEFSQSIVLTNQAGQSQRVATASFTRVVGSAETVAVFTLPYEVSLQEEVALSVDDAALGALSWQSCDAGGCYASAPVAEAWMQAMRAGDQLAATLTARDGRDITFTFALEGFSSAADLMP